MKRSFADILAGLDDDRARKVARKLPEWAAADAQRRASGLDGLEFPSALSLEQCSSTATARYKAALISEQAVLAPRGGSSPRQNFASLIPPTAEQRVPPIYEAMGGHGFAGATSPDVPQQPVHSLPAASSVSATTKQARLVLDLTGGLGVDSWAFAQVAERVVYYERDAELAGAAERNFARLGADNIEVRCETVTPATELPEADLIYADPARRNAAGRKVFLLEDCTPDILTLLPMLLQRAPAVLLKLSPMADLAMLAERLGAALREIHVVEHDGEVKELLCLLLRDSSPAEPEIIIDSFRFRSSEERQAEAVYAAEVRPGDVLLEPAPALLKAGAFRLPCSRWGLHKLAHSTHLYLLPAVPGTEAPSSVPGEPFFAVPGTETPSSVPGKLCPEAAPWFKARRVCDVLPFGAAAFKTLRQRYPKAEITARNLPLGSDALRKKMGIAPGGDTHIFGCRFADGSAVLLVCEAEAIS